MNNGNQRSHFRPWEWRLEHFHSAGRVWFLLVTIVWLLFRIAAICDCTLVRATARQAARGFTLSTNSTMNHLLKLPRLATRAFSTTTKQMKNKVPDHQKIFQADNGLPVHIKGGTTDVLLYRLTMTITLAGTGYSLFWILCACQPKGKWGSPANACVYCLNQFHFMNFCHGTISVQNKSLHYASVSRQAWMSVSV